MTTTADLPVQHVPAGDDAVRQRVQANAFDLRTYRGHQAMELMRNDRPLTAQVVDMIARAFCDNPSYRLLFEVDPSGRAARTQLTKRLFQALTPTSILIVAFDSTVQQDAAGSEVLVGVLCGVGTHAEYLSNTDIPADILARHAELVKQHEPTRAELAAIFDKTLYGAYESAPYSTPFAIAPGYQSAGLGTKMMEAFHEAVEGMAVSLHAATRDQARFYARLGYAPAARHTLYMPDGSKVDLDLLVRPARSA